MSRYILSVIFLMSYTWLSAQAIIGVEEILQYNDSLLMSRSGSDEFTKFASKSQKEISPIEKMEFRTETDRWDVARQEYTVRTSLKSRGEVKAEKNILKSWEKIISLENAEERQERLSDVYQLLIELHNMEQYEKVVTEMLSVAKDQKSVLISSLAYDSDLSTTAVLKAEDDILDFELRLAKLKSRSASIVSRVYVKNNVRVDFSSWMDVSDLRRAFESLIENKGMHPEVLKQAEELLLKEVELGKEQAKGGRILDFMQMKYSANENIVNGNQLSLGVSVLLPSGHANKENIREANIDVFRELTNAERTVAKIKRDQEEAISDFRELESSWMLLTERLQGQDLQGTLERLATSEGVRAKTLLDVKEMILARQLEQLKIEKSMYEKYLELSELKGSLVGPTAHQIFNAK